MQRWFIEKLNVIKRALIVGINFWCNQNANENAILITMLDAMGRR
jgi:hypothetical protein